MNKEICHIPKMSFLDVTWGPTKFVTTWALGGVPGRRRSGWIRPPLVPSRGQVHELSPARWLAEAQPWNRSITVPACMRTRGS